MIDDIPGLEIVGVFRGLIVIDNMQGLIRIHIRMIDMRTMNMQTIDIQTIKNADN